jgi:putative flippase GtrA
MPCPPLRVRLLRFVRFCVVGASSTTIDFGLLAALTNGLGWHPLLANPLSFGLGVTNGFYWNRRWTFPEARQEEPVGQYGRFVVVNGIGLLLDQAVLATVMALGPAAGWSDDPSKWAGKIASMPLVVVWNYTAHSLWTFKRRPRLD